MTMKLSINPNIIDKSPSTKRAYGEGWVALNIEPDELSGYIDDGYAFSAQFKGDRRRSSEFAAADFVAVDFDGAVPLADAKELPLIRDHATIIYTTPSHRKGGVDRFRVVFRTPYTIEESAVWRAALTGLAKTLGADMAATDGARLFFGSRGSDPIVMDGMLSVEILDELIQLGHAIRQAAKNRDASAAISGANFQSDRTISPTQEIACSDGFKRIIVEIPDRMRVHCPVHADNTPSAFRLTSTKGSPGIYCSTCMRTFWLEGKKRQPYDYYEFERHTIELAKSEPQEAAATDNAWNFGSDERVTATAAVRAVVHDSKYLPPVLISGGVALVRSPKGSGKTAGIEGIVSQARLSGKSVLMIGHRRTLLSELSARLGLKCYLQDEDRQFTSTLSPAKANKARQQFSKKRPDYYAVSIDSLAMRLPWPRPFDIVIIDESEQVLSHICAKTIDDPQPILKILQHYITNTPCLYMFDADLNKITTGFVTRCRATREAKPSDPLDTLLRIVNLPKMEQRKCQVFEDASDLQADLLQSLTENKRVFVACNSKRRAEGLAGWLKGLLPDARVLLVTADDKDEPAVRAFLGDVPTKFLLYDAVIASPAIGTGIDITFPGGEQKIDTVYGFFDSQINTHYDIDQQLGRVRNPGAVKVWISDEEDYFETETDAIKLELVLTGKTNMAITGYEPDGAPVYNMEDPLLNLQADAYAAIRASQNRLQHYFLEHTRHNSWLIEHISKSDNHGAATDLTASFAAIDAGRVKSLLTAQRITRERHDDYLTEREQGGAIGIEARYEVERYEIEYFYGQTITEDLIKLDDGGRYRAKVERFEGLAIHSDFGVVEEQLCDYWVNGSWSEAFSEKTKHLLDAVLISSGLVNASGFKPDAVISAAGLEQFVSLCRDRRQTLEMEFGVRLRKDFSRKPIRSLNALLDLIGLSVSMTTFEKKDGKRTYYYQLDSAQLATMMDAREKRRAAKAERSRDNVERITAYYKSKEPRLAENSPSVWSCNWRHNFW